MKGLILCPQTPAIVTNDDNNIVNGYSAGSYSAEARIMRLQDSSQSTLSPLIDSQSVNIVASEVINSTLCSATNFMVASVQETTATGSLSPGLKSLIIASLSFMIIITIIGNVLVVLSVLLVKKLRHPSSNYLLVSLAISDLCVATLVMPFALYSEITSWSQSPGWHLGRTICNLYVSFDVTCCTASILNLCVISIDRYLAITRPLTYGVSATTRRTLCYIAAIWVASCLISIPPLFMFGNEHGGKERPTCEVSQNMYYQMYATLGAFYIPLTVMIVMYYKIYVAAKKVVEAELKTQPSKSRPLVSVPLIRRPTQANCGRSLAFKNEAASPVLTGADLELGGQSVVPSDALRGPLDNNRNDNSTSKMGFLGDNNGDKLYHHQSSHTDHLGHFDNISRRRHSSALRERKASITLGVIMTAFTVCWLPFFILALLRPFSQSVNSIPDWIVAIFYWLGFFNSMLNPMIYVTFHQDFRRAFKYLLCLQCSTLDIRLREEAYQSQYGDQRSSFSTNYGLQRKQSQFNNGTGNNFCCTNYSPVKGDPVAVAIALATSALGPDSGPGRPDPLCPPGQHNGSPEMTVPCEQVSQPLETEVNV
ncbi:5-hydroxytryptamine receptor 1A-alpha [Halotydeus destructor]|nr:5-hydroxytryptamine receptor 1A-alpha [Halotydeus destructor]